MSNQALFAQAIADAKAVREAALANAKAALEETFAPRIKEMISLKLSEELDEDLDEVKDEVEEGIEEYRIKKPASKVEMQEKADKDEDNRIKEGDDQVDETYNMEESLDEILAELEALDEDEKSKGMEETKSDDDPMMKEMDHDDDKEKLTIMPEAKDEEGEEDAEDESEEDEEGGEEITELTVDELKDIIHDVVAELMGQSGESKSQEMPAGEEVSDMEVTDIDEMLSELDEESNDENIYEAKKVKTKAEKAAEEKAEKAAEEKAEKAEKKAEKAEKELKEAISVIKTLKESINEVNLLNAKLLYVNKIFKAKSLAESQKVKVINAFDRATTINEVKNIYSTIKESISEVKKTGLQESIGFASKAIGNAPKQIIVEGDAVINRLQKLAGIIK